MRRSAFPSRGRPIHVLLSLCLVPLVMSCSPSAGPGPGDGASSPASGGTAAPTPTAAATTPQPDLTSAPTTPPAGEEIALDRSADFGDGLVIEVDNVRAGAAGSEISGAEGTDGSIVTADIVVANDTGSDFPADAAVIQGYYRGNVGAVLVSDSSGILGLGFAEAIPSGEQHRTAVGFAVPAPDVGDVTIVVDPRDGVHDPVQFRGAADRG